MAWGKRVPLEASQLPPLIPSEDWPKLPINNLLLQFWEEREGKKIQSISQVIKMAFHMLLDLSCFVN